MEKNSLYILLYNSAHVTRCEGHKNVSVVSSVFTVCIDFRNNVLLPPPRTVREIPVARVVKYIAEVIYLLCPDAFFPLSIHKVIRYQVKYNRFPCRILSTFGNILLNSFQCIV